MTVIRTSPIKNSTAAVFQSMNLPLATAFISFYKVFYFTMLIEAGFLPPPSASPSICFPLRPLMNPPLCYDVCLFPYFCFVCIFILLLLIIVLFYSVHSPPFIPFSGACDG